MLLPGTPVVWKDGNGLSRKGVIAGNTGLGYSVVTETDRRRLIPFDQVTPDWES